MRIIPAIDILNGKCVRLTQGDYATQKIYNENPLEVAKEFEDNGIKYLHVVDLDGARSQHIVNHKILYEIASGTNLKIDFGGGVKSKTDLEIAFQSGANQVTGGSIAIKEPEIFLEWLEIYGADKIILGADCSNRKISSMGWLQESETDVLDFIKQFEKRGIKYVVCTDIAKDGMLVGAAEKLYEEIIRNTNVKLIASGGVSSLDDVKRLSTIGCEGVIIGKAIYEGRITIKELVAL